MCAIVKKAEVPDHPLPTDCLSTWLKEVSLGWEEGLALVAEPSLKLFEETWSTVLILVKLRSSLCPGNKITSLLSNKNTALGLVMPAVTWMETVYPGQPCASKK